MDKIPMQVVLTNKKRWTSDTITRLRDAFKRVFGEKYDIVYTTGEVGIELDDLKVVTFSENSDIDKIIESLDKYAEARLNRK